jgi:methyl coenzyme M reductase subunit C-like uncharacterized protein (methanogenesis marker protein 7)
MNQSRVVRARAVERLDDLVDVVLVAAVIEERRAVRRASPPTCPQTTLKNSTG